MNVKHICRIFLILSVMFLLSSIASARFEYAAKESRNCPYCHAGEPPVLNDIGVYYASNNHSLEGYKAPKVTPTPEPTQELKEIGVHMKTWDVGMIVIAAILLMLVIVYAIRL